MRRLTLAFAFGVLLSARGLAAGPERAYLAPWIVVSPSDARVLSLGELPASKLSQNSPGLLLAISDERDPGVAEALSRLVSSSHRAGRRAGLVLTLRDVPVSVEPRAAEAATADTLYPGLGSILKAAAGADLVELDVPALNGESKSASFVLRKIASEVRAIAPSAKIAITFRAAGAELFPSGVAAFLTEELTAYVDEIGLVLPDADLTPERIREEADKIVFGRPALVRLSKQVADPDTLLGLAAASAPSVITVAAPLASPPPADASLDRLGQLLSADFSRDGRAATAKTADRRDVPVFRVVSGLDLGGVVLVPARDASGNAFRGALSLTLDTPSYAAAEIVELATGRRKRFDIPRSADPPRLSLSTATGSIALVLTAREKAPSETTKANVGVSAERGLTAEEILAKHQAWRAARDARWHRFSARNETSIRFRFADLNNTLDLTLSGAFFYEIGKGYDWTWSEAYFNGVKWRGKKIPELPLVQPEKVSELPLALTFNDAYTYALVGEDTFDGVRCYVLSFEPRETKSDKPLYAGRVFISKSDFAVVRTITRQLNLVGEVQSVDEESDFTEVPAPDGGAPMRFPTHTRGQWILRTFSRTTVLERETMLRDVRLDPPTYEEDRKKAFASNDVMVRDTEKGVRYLERTKEGDRVVVEDAKTSRLFGLAGVFYDPSLDFPLPLLGLYYLDLDFRKKHEQVQVFFGGVLLLASFNEPRLFGTKIDFGADVFGIAIRGNDSLYVTGTEDESQRVKQRAFAGNLNLGAPVGGHVKLSLQVGTTHRDFADDSGKTAPDFAVPSNHWVTRVQAQAIMDIQGWALSARYSWNKRSTWEPWGFPGNPDYDPSKDEYRLYGALLAKDFHFPKFQRIRSSLAYLGSSNADRFSKYQFGTYGGTPLRGFRSSALRADEAVIIKGAYGLVFGDALRVELIYDHAIVKDREAGLDWANFGGAGLSGQLPGPWSTIVQFDVGTPVVGRNRGQKGFVLSLVLLKIF